MKTYLNSFRRFNKDIWLYLALWCAISFGYFGVVGVLMNLYLVRLGYGTEFIGLMHGSGQLIWGVFALPAAMLGSRLGAKRMMTSGMVFNAVGMVLLLSVEALPVDVQPVWLVFSWMIGWVGAALTAVNSAPYLMAVTDDQSRGFAFSAQQTVMAAAGFAGSVAGGFLPALLAGQLNLALDHPAPFRLALLLSPVAYMLGAFAFSRTKPAGQVFKQEETGGGQRAPASIFVFIGLLTGIQAFSEGTVRAFFNVYLDTVFAVPTGQIGTIMGVSSLFIVPISLAAPAILARLGTRGTIILSASGLAFFILALSWSPTALFSALAYVGMSSMTMIMTTARGIFSQEIVFPRWRTTVSAFGTIGMALGWSSSAYLGGSLIKIIGFQGLFILGAASAILSAGFVLVQLRVHKGSVYEQKDAVAGEQA
jgi:MFS family permease